jgi:hypothetical protein
VSRQFLAAVAAAGLFLLGSSARAAEGTDSGLPVVAPDSQAGAESASESQAHPNDERWLSRPFSAGLSSILGMSQGGAPFLMLGAEFAYALPYVSFGATLGYLDGINGSLAARGRLHLGHAVALTLGARGAHLPLDDDCWFDFGQTADSCDQNRRWKHAFFGGGELGVEGRTEAGFMWRAQVGLWGLLGHGGGVCRTTGSAMDCAVPALTPGVVFTQELTVGWAF